MNVIEICSLPVVRYAHSFEADPYQTRLCAGENCIEVTYVVEGVLNFQMGQHTFSAQKGEVVCLLHDRDVHLSSPGFHRHHTVAATVHWRFTESGADGLYLPTIIRAEEGAADLTSRIDDFVHRQRGYTAPRIQEATAFLDLLCRIDQGARRSHPFHSPGEQLYTQRAKAYIGQHIHAPITQQAVAEHLGISPGYLCRIFKRQEGIPLMKYINKTKLENIRALVERENLHLYEAAPLYGYSDPNYVSRLYKRLFGHNLTQPPVMFTEEE